MNNPTLAGAAESAAPVAALPTSTTPTPGVQETPGTFDSDATRPTRLADSGLAVVANPPAPGPVLPDPSGLTPAQLIAFEALTSGERSQVAAERAGVSILTIFHWSQRDPRFVAAMNAWRAKKYEDMRQKVRELHQTAYEKYGREYEQMRARKNRRG